MSIGMFIIPMGTFLIGATFILRDLVQNKHGKKTTYKYIIIALLLSALTSFFMGDTLFVVLASALSFIVSETIDTEIYSRCKGDMGARILYSGLAGGLLDSVLFVIIALSPIGMGILAWNMVGFAILGQVVVKSIMQILGVVSIKLLKHNI
jgi:hypothetical protein